MTQPLDPQDKNDHFRDHPIPTNHTQSAIMSTSKSKQQTSSDTSTTTYHHETEPIITDVRTGTEFRPLSGMTSCSCNGNQGECSCAPNTCACAGCGMKSTDNPTRESHGPNPGMGARVMYEPESVGRGGSEGMKMATGTQYRGAGKGGDCGCSGEIGRAHV